MADFSYNLDDYDFELPPESIAQRPVPNRDQSRLLVLDTVNSRLLHRKFVEIADYLRPGDLLVVNNTKVFPARLLGNKTTGGKVELFLLEFPKPVGSEAGFQSAQAPALIKSSKRPKPGSTLFFSEELQAIVDGYTSDGKADVRLLYTGKEDELEVILQRHGQIPLPPYIQRQQGDSFNDAERYQTRYARHTGSVAAPTAGLHFSDSFLQSIEKSGISLATVTLHVGYGTFAPVRVEDIRDHEIHREQFTITEDTVEAVQATRKRGGRVWAVGTTTVRTLEYATDGNGVLHPLSGECDLFIYPGYRFRTVDNLITNFHLPKSSLMFLVSALAGREQILNAYREAIACHYRFFSYGDAMAIITKA